RRRPTTGCASPCTWVRRRWSTSRASATPCRRALAACPPRSTSIRTGCGSWPRAGASRRPIRAFRASARRATCRASAPSSWPRSPGPESASTSCGAPPGARPRGRGLPDRADPCPAPHLEGRRRAALRPARGGGRGALHPPAQTRPLLAALRRRVRRRARCAGGGGLMSVAATLDLDGMLRRLHLPTVRRLYAELATRAEEEGMSYRDYLATLIAEEIAHRAQTRITRAVRKARFPFLRTIEEFDFT